MNIRKELIEGIIQGIIKYLCEDKNYNIEKAMEIVYNSQIFTKVIDEETGLYKESPSFVYELLKDELEYGKIVQREI